MVLSFAAVVGGFGAAMAPREAILAAVTTPAVLVGFAAGLVSLIGIARWLAAGTTVGLRRFLLLVIPGTLALGSWAVAVAVWAA